MVQTLQFDRKFTFFEFFSKIICVYEKKVVPLHRQTKNKKFNQLKTKHYDTTTNENFRFGKSL